MFRIAIGLTCLVLSTLFVASAFGLIPDPRQGVLEARKRWTETVALDCAMALERKDETFLKAFLPLLLQREPDLQSVGIRTEEGRLLYEGGDHRSSSAKETESVEGITIPLRLQDQPWGRLEFQFKPRQGFLGLFRGSLLVLVLFFGITTLIGVSTYLRLALRHKSGGDKAAQRVQAMLDTVAEGVLVLDREQRIILANRSFAARISADREELSGRKVHELPWLQRDPSPGSLPWAKSLSQKTTEIGSILSLQATPDEVLKFSVNSTPVLGEDGECKGALATFDDLTFVEHKNAELKLANHKLQVSEKKIRHQAKNLKSAKAAAEAANKAKSEFLTNVSHEIRTPMNAILGMADVALEMAMPSEQRECFEMVKGAGENLLDLINELLDFSKIEAGKFSLALAPFQLLQTVSDTVRLFASKANRQGLELLCDIAPDVPDALNGDAARLRQILINLTGNALKFTSAGQVQLRVRRAENQPVPGKVCLHFQVQDTGIGIPADKHDAIFQPFVQADGSTTRKYGGTGLGLSICTELVHMMGGRLWVESAAGVGSTFHFLVSFEPSGAETRPSPDLANVPRNRLLVVDPNADALRITSALLQGWGFPVEAVRGGLQALEKLEEAVGSQKPFNLVLISDRLSDMDGYDLAHVARKCCPSQPRVVMMLSSLDRRKDQERCQQLGVTATLSKPVSADNLARTLQKMFAPRGPEEPEALSRPSSPGFSSQLPPLRILFVDDNLFNQRVGQMKLAPRGHTVCLAGSGAETLAILAREAFDLLLLDMQMPDMDGLEVTRRIRRQEEQGGGHLPIIAVTAHSHEEVRKQCLEAGMDGYVAKPIHDEELWRAIRTALGEEAIRNLSRGTPAKKENPAAEVAVKPSQVEDARITAILTRIGGNRAMLRDLARIYTNDSVKLLAAIGEGLQKAEPKKVEIAAHSLKGMLAFFDVLDGVEQARNLERLGTEGNLEGGQAFLEQLTKVNEQVLTTLSGFSD